MSISPARPVTRPSLSLGKTVLIATVIEAALILGSGGLILSAVAEIQPRQEPPVQIVFADLEKKEVRPEKPKLLPKPEPVVKPVLAPIAGVIPPEPLPPLLLDTPVAAPKFESPVVESPVPVVTPPPPRSNPVAEREAEFASRVKAAIQAAVAYPPAARAMGFVGRARVEFHLRDAVPGQARIIFGSGIGMIDRAALAAVTNAAYPEVPDSLKGKDQVYQVTVQFELNTTR